MSGSIEKYDKIASESRCLTESMNGSYSNFQNSYPGVFDFDKNHSPTGNGERKSVFKQSDLE